MGQVVIAGALTGGPSVASPNQVPGASFNASLFFANGSRPAGAMTGNVFRTLNSPGAFQALGEIGATGDVSACDFFYINAQAPVDIEVTADNPLGGTTVAVVSCQGGPTMISTAANKVIRGIRLQGSGAIEYFASGSQ